VPLSPKLTGVGEERRGRLSRAQTFLTMRQYSANLGLTDIAALSKFLFDSRKGFDGSNLA